MYDSKWERKADKQDAQHKKDDERMKSGKSFNCLLYTSDAADE